MAADPVRLDEPAGPAGAEGGHGGASVDGITIAGSERPSQRPSVRWLSNISYRMPTQLRNRAIGRRRLLRPGLLTDGLDYRSTPCSVCGEALWQYPKPSYWMQYPLMNDYCLLVDGVILVCSERCAEEVLRRGEQLQLPLCCQDLSA